MRKLNRMLVIVGLLAGMMGAAPARALLISQCSGSYSRTATCTFSIAGPTIYVYGNTSSQSIEVRVTDAAGAVWILSCRGGSSCSGQLGPQSLGTDSFGLPAGVPLLCTVIASGPGFYGCGSIV